MKRPIDWREDRSAVREKVAESAHCVLPIVLIVVLLCLTAAPMKPDLLLSFLIGGVMLVVGMGLFSLGAEQSMTPIGTKIGTALTRTKNLPLILGVSFALGFAITVAEPDLQVLAETVPHISRHLVSPSYFLLLYLELILLQKALQSISMWQDKNMAAGCMF